MESLQNIKRRIKGVQNIRQITKAMEMVAATKMRRSQEIALASRAYGFAALDLLGTISALEDIRLPSLLQERPVQKRAIVMVTSDKGLAGAFNGSVIREFEAFVKEKDLNIKDENNSFIAVGQKAVNYLERRAHGLAGKFVKFGDYTTLEEIDPLYEKLVQGFLAGEWDQVDFISTNFRSALNQEVLVSTVLPVNPESLRKTLSEIVPETGKFTDLRERIVEESPATSHEEYLIEPNPSLVLESLVPHLVRTEIYQTILEANASEWAARRLAMKTASDNAKDLKDDLTLEFNKSRQAAITREISEISAGAEALSESH